MNPKVKKIIAREWLIFLLVLILGPPIESSLWATYEWTRAGRLVFTSTPVEEMMGLDWSIQGYLQGHSRLNKDLYYRLDRDKAEIELRKLAKPQRGEETDLWESIMQERAAEEAKPKKGSLILIYHKPPLSAYLYNQVLDPINYQVYLILTFLAYLGFLFFRSVVWSVRTLRHKEP